ncbi:MAG: hypothetical protein P3X24_003200 [bacterium]|nr:hypothetical protein [bacterium]
MKRHLTLLGLAAIAVMLHGCGGGGGASGGVAATANERVFVVRVSDPTNGAPIENAEIYFVTDTGQTIPMARVVAGSTSAAPNTVPMSIARGFKSDIRAGDFVLRNVGDSLFFRGFWVRRPAGYTAIVRHTTPENIRRVIQTPNAPNVQAACLVASNQAGVVSAVFGAPRVVDFGTIEIFPNNPQIPPPPVDDQCP